jgi:uncharacterized protein (DUF1810 family)
MFDLKRFKDAQDSVAAGIADALRELRAGRKTGHWIWYVFPQLAGLGRSPTAIRYGLSGADETAAYLRDPLLVERLVKAVALVRDHVTRDQDSRISLEELMGSDVDATKLVSCLTLFSLVARRLSASEPRPEFSALIEHADAILSSAVAEGYARCAFTEKQLATAK